MTNPHHTQIQMQIARSQDVRHRSCKTGPECERNVYTGTLSADARLAAHPTRSLGVI